MKKTRLVAVAAAILLGSAVIFGSAFVGKTSQYNDYTYKTYLNLELNSDIPSLFKNDTVFSSYKEYPPVISNGIEYVPLEIFYGLSNIKISFSEDASNFYIQNKKANKYISFSISGNYAVT